MRDKRAMVGREKKARHWRVVPRSLSASLRTGSRPPNQGGSA